MAKKKKQSGAQNKKPVSPERYIKENARKLPVGKCYINEKWQEHGMAHILVTRPRPNGYFVIADFIVDTFCLGVKDAFYTITWTQSDIDDFLSKWHSFTEIPYEEAHNIIYGAISFAEDADIEPHKDFNVAQYVLEEDTDDIPLIDYEFGHDGKYLLIVGEDGKERKYLNTLRERLGDRFDFILPIGQPDIYNEDDEDLDFDNFDDFPDEPYTYQHPDYPSELSVKHQFIADAFANKDYYERLPNDIIERILALPREEAVADIHNIVLFTIGRTYKAIDDRTIEDDENGSIMHSLIILSALKSPVGLETVLEIMRQNGNFADFHLGDLAPEVIPQALYACCKDNLQPMIDYMYTPGFDTYMRNNCLDALVMIAVNDPERRDEIISIFHELFESLEERLPYLDGCDGTFAAFAVSAAIDLKAKELLPEIETLFGTGLVDPSITGDFKSVLADFNGGRAYYDHLDRYSIHTPDELYRRIESFGS